MRRLASDEHKLRWKEYENLLILRTLAAQVMRTLTFVLLASLDMTVITQSEKYLEAGGPPRGEEMANQVNEIC